MSYCRNLLVVAVCYSFWVAPAHGQVQALPAYTAEEEPTLQEPLPQYNQIAQISSLPAVNDQTINISPIRQDYRTWQILPDGLMYKSYLAGHREPRFATNWFHEKDHGWLWDSTLGGRVGILRYGTTDPVNPQGWQLDSEGAAFPRRDMENGRDLVSVDFRFGIPLTSRAGPWETKFGYYHLSSHLGDEYMVFHSSLDRVNYARDCLVLGVAFLPNPDVRLYAEMAWAFYVNGGSEPWEFQFGVEYSPARPSGFRGDPFFAVNGFIREEVNYGGNLTVQTGWQWRGESGHLFRIGMQYFNGMSNQYQFFNLHEEQIGMALWYDY